MTELAATALAPARASRLGQTGRVGASTLALVLLGVGFADLLSSANIPFGLALAGGIALVGFLALTISHYDTAVAIGLLLMGIVRFEPAPPDMAFAVIMAVAAMTGRFRLHRVPVIVRWIVALLLVVNLLSLMDVLSMSTALRFLFITVYLVIFSLWLTGYVDRPSKARMVVVTWLVIGVASAIISAAALNLPVPGRSLILGSVDNAERASGFFKDPNVFGPFLIPIALILIEQRIAPRSPQLLRMRGWSTWACLLALALGILLSYSRAAWLNFALALMIVLAASAMRRRGAARALRALMVLLVIGGVIVVILSATGSIGFLEHRAQLHQSYDTGRFAAQSLGWELGWTHPVGIGPGQFESYSAVAAQSTFVRVFSEQGPAALLLWIALLLATLVLAVRNVVIGRDTYGIGSASLLGAWCGMILNSTVVDTLHWRHMWVVAALIWASTTQRETGREASLRARFGLSPPRRLAVAPSPP